MDTTTLPYDVFEKILSYTDGYTLFQCRIVCSNWKRFLDENDHLWKVICQKEFKHASRIAKLKCGNELKWYNVYRNLKKWPQYEKCERNLKKFYHFVMHDKMHLLNIENSILPLREKEGTILYDMRTLKYLPVVIPEKNCLKVSNNDLATVVQVKNGIHIQRNIDDKNQINYAFFKADKFILDKDLYYFNNRDVFKCDLKSKELTPKLLLHSEYDLKEIQYSDRLHLFTDCGRIINLNRNETVEIKKINCPDEWIKSIKHISAVDDKNFVCYSRNLFKIETDNYKHLFLDFPKITALFFYGDTVLFGTRAGEIVLYRVCNEKLAINANFEKLAVLPESKFAVNLDVYEREQGPIIVIGTFNDVFVLEINLFPKEENVLKKRGEFANKLPMYKRLLKLKEKLRSV